ncbi:MAG TPA: methyltransferase domain-containing protein [Mycobacteriales bacterium]|nr:methyltransferase domain-containing protein [Mycobacteriales bacterium]
MTALTLTGERTLPGIEAENYWFRRHEAAYVAMAPFCRGAGVVDAGSGEGYGAALLHRLGAGSVAGLELDPSVATHAAERYAVVPVARADLQRLPLRSSSVEVVVSSQVIEHLWDQPGFVTECARALRPAGTLIVTTPNRLTFSPGLAVPVNPFHTRELSPDELVELLAPRFSVSRVLGVSHGRRIRRWERRHGSLVSAQLAAPPEAWPAHLTSFVRSIRADDFAVSARGLDSSLDLFAVAVRRAS